MYRVKQLEQECKNSNLKNSQKINVPHHLIRYWRVITLGYNNSDIIRSPKILYSILEEVIWAIIKWQIMKYSSKIDLCKWRAYGERHRKNSLLWAVKLKYLPHSNTHNARLFSRYLPLLYYIGFFSEQTHWIWETIVTCKP